MLNENKTSVLVTLVAIVYVSPEMMIQISSKGGIRCITHENKYVNLLFFLTQNR